MSDAMLVDKFGTDGRPMFKQAYAFREGSAVPSTAEMDAVLDFYDASISEGWTLTAEGPERKETTEWREYLKVVDANDGQTPRERLAGYFA
jgi:hypothetical protein